MDGLGATSPSEVMIQLLVNTLSVIVKANGIANETCTEKVDLEETEVKHGFFIDGEMVE